MIYFFFLFFFPQIISDLSLFTSDASLISKLELLVGTGALSSLSPLSGVAALAIGGVSERA